jgi:hypothetical protein
MNEEKSLPSLLKILIVSILLVFVLVLGFIYSRKLDNWSFADNEKQEKVQVEQVQNKKEVVDYDELVRNYKKNLIKVIDEFNGDYQGLQEQIVEIVVPSGFQDLHLQLVLALNHVLYEDNPDITKTKLQKIADDNDWLTKSLNKIILNII